MDYARPRLAQSIPVVGHIGGKFPITTTSGQLPPRWKTLKIEYTFVEQSEFIKSHHTRGIAPKRHLKLCMSQDVVKTVEKKDWTGTCQPN